MNNFKLLWVDDEIDLLKPHILFLQKKNYEIETCQSGAEAIETIKEKDFDLMFLDENMPGISGLETLTQIKNLKPDIKVVMVTKSEEEYIMEEAIGNKIADYLIKPVNPNQLLLSLKKNLDHDKLVSEKTSSQYRQAFMQIGDDISQATTYEDWVNIYKKIIHWELELDETDDGGMSQILDNQKEEANNSFFKFISNNYINWFKQGQDKPVLSHTLLNNKVFNDLNEDGPTMLVVVDNLRFDQLRMIEPKIKEFYQKEQESAYYSILPTATQYARNAMFSGLMPLDMQKLFPDLWLNDTDEGGKNQYEAKFLAQQLKRLGKPIDFSYYKITDQDHGRKLVDTVHQEKHRDLIVVVYNFVDMLSHAKTDMKVIKELAADDRSYRSLTASWFNNSPLLNLIKEAQNMNCKLMITTDHGTINVKQPTQVKGDRETSLNLRYKTGKSLSYNKKEVMAIKDPSEAHLPSINMSSSYIFARNDQFLAYPNNYNYYANYYKNTYQHGGISMEEMIIPFCVYNPK